MILPFFAPLILSLVLASCNVRPEAYPHTPATQTQMTGNPSPSTASHTLVVFAAASLTEAFTEIGKNFEAQFPGGKVIFNFAGSQQLSQQISQGAQADVFASANQQKMNDLIQSGEISSGASLIFAKNRLVVIYPKDNPAGLSHLQDLAKPNLKLVLAANEVPAGQYSLDFLDKAAGDPAFGPGYKDQVLKNVVSYEENVRAVLTKVILGEADAGIVYSSDLSAQDAAQTGRIEIPDALNIIATYPIAILKNSQNAALAKAFVDLVLSNSGQHTLAKYGFIPVK